MTHSVLRGLTPDRIDRDPFPHVVVDEALDPALYRELEAALPPAETLLRGRAMENNTPYRYSAEHILAEGSPRWREFARLHTSAAFFADVVALFGDTIRTLHPALEARAGKRLEEMKSSIRFVEPFADVALDCQITYGSPVTRATRCHRVHVDRQVALYAGLLYFRRSGDDSSGGDLELYRFRGNARTYDEGRYVDDALVERVKTIPYAANRLAFFIHSPEALHGVSVRSVTPHPRLHVNFIAEFRAKVWELAA
ncbi:MAG TPA: hypothetical protein VNA69_11085 [Thermoanaerobaculia bacterium]|nr:hypothetical protein [Thermoanaerobaculia bacterium]